jgi:hypothetical protein
MSTPTEVDAVQVVKDLIAERDRLRQQVAEQQEELTRLANERDAYRRDAHALLPKPGAFTEKDVAEWERTGLTLEEFVHEIDEMSRKDSADDKDGIQSCPK